MSTLKNSYGIIIVDVQGKLAGLVNDAQALQSRILALVSLCLAQDRPIIICEQMPEKLGSTIQPISDAATTASFFSKSTFNAMQNDGLRSSVTQNSHWAVVGIEAHICVYQTVKAMLGEGIDVSLITDAVSSRNVGDRHVAVAAMQAAGAGLKTTEMQLYEWLERADNSLYKDMLPIIKSLPANTYGLS